VTLHEKIIAREFPQSYHSILAGGDLALDTTNTENDTEMKKEAKESILHRMAKVHDFWRCGRAARTYMQPTRNLALKLRR
jgi:hypothetical protein